MKVIAGSTLVNQHAGGAYAGILGCHLVWEGVIKIKLYKWHLSCQHMLADFKVYYIQLLNFFSEGI